MKKYILIKEYPGSPMLGAIAKYVTGDGGVYEISDPCHQNKPCSLIEKYPEYWQEIVEKDYEILSFYMKGIEDKNTPDPDYIWKSTSRDGKSWAKINKKGKFVTKPYSIHEIEALTDKFGIYSVKRLSDGEVFTIGDRIDSSSDNIGWEIVSFHFGNTDLSFINVKHPKYVDSSICSGLDKIKHAKKLLFTTEDSVDIYEGDDYYSVHATHFDFPNGYGKPSARGTAQGGYWISFSTKQAAEEYILMNKPCLSLKEALNNTIYGLNSLARSRL